LAPYGTSKAGVVALTRALALHWVPRLRAKAVAPGLTATDMVATIPEHLAQRMRAQIPLERMALPDKIAGAVEFLQSTSSAYVTGQTLLVCGGRSLQTP
jgi:NAD(P)-dependent dehydrogenase (short-subunit alcohol dehydrogenase family)